jgi:hypothetical protein
MIQRPAGSTKGIHGSFKDSPTYQTLKTFKKPSQLLRGYTALAARNLPFTAMQFPAYEHLKKSTNTRRQEKGTATGTLTETATVTAISAAIAGSFAALITTPVDVVKTRMMLSASEESPDVGQQKKLSLSSIVKEAACRKGSLAVAREVLSESGVKGLFRGGSLRSAWTALGSGLYLGVYESGRVWLAEWRNGKVA